MLRYATKVSHGVESAPNGVLEAANYSKQLSESTSIPFNIGLEVKLLQRLQVTTGFVVKLGG